MRYLDFKKDGLFKMIISIALKVSLVTAAIGLCLGFLGQRSRMCFIGGWRDFFLIRDTYLLKGFFAFLIAAAVFYGIMDFKGEYLPNYPWFEQLDEMSAEILGDVQTIPDQCDLTPIPVISDEAVAGITIGGITITGEILLMFFAAFGLGLFSTLANGCPLRQHVMAGSGNLSAWLYLLGFYIAVIFYNLFINDFLNYIIS